MLFYLIIFFVMKLDINFVLTDVKPIYSHSLTWTTFHGLIQHSLPRNYKQTVDLVQTDKLNLSFTVPMCCIDMILIITLIFSLFLLACSSWNRFPW